MPPCGECRPEKRPRFSSPQKGFDSDPREDLRRGTSGGSKLIAKSRDCEVLRLRLQHDVNPVVGNDLVEKSLEVERIDEIRVRSRRRKPKRPNHPPPSFTLHRVDRRLGARE